jgi:hypothetical protein
MMVTIAEFTDQITRAGLAFEITRDSRGSVPGGPISISITRSQRPFTDLSLRTLNRIDQSPDDTESYFITHVTIDEAATLRVQKQLAPTELWALVYETRLRTINPPREQRRRFHHQPRHSRYVTRPSKHIRNF